MTVIAVDGKYITPVDVGTIHMHSGKDEDVLYLPLATLSSYYVNFVFTNSSKKPHEWVREMIRTILGHILPTHDSAVTSQGRSTDFYLRTLAQHCGVAIEKENENIMPDFSSTAWFISSFLGERVDVVINASLKWSQYWIRVQGNDFCSSARQSAILHYKDAKKNILSSKSSKKIFTQFSKILPVGNQYCSQIRKNVWLIL